MLSFVNKIFSTVQLKKEMFMRFVGFSCCPQRSAFKMATNQWPLKSPVHGSDGSVTSPSLDYLNVFCVKTIVLVRVDKLTIPGEWTFMVFDFHGISIVYKYIYIIYIYLYLYDVFRIKPDMMGSPLIQSIKPLKTTKITDVPATSLLVRCSRLLKIMPLL